MKLNEALALKVGAQDVMAVYAGAVKVWPATAPVSFSVVASDFARGSGYGYATPTLSDVISGDQIVVLVFGISGNTSSTAATITDSQQNDYTIIDAPTLDTNSGVRVALAEVKADAESLTVSARWATGAASRYAVAYRVRGRMLTVATADMVGGSQSTAQNIDTIVTFDHGPGMTLMLLQTRSVASDPSQSIIVTSSPIRQDDGLYDGTDYGRILVSHMVRTESHSATSVSFQSDASSALRNAYVIVPLTY